MKTNIILRVFFIFLTLNSLKSEDRKNKTIINNGLLNVGNNLDISNLEILGSDSKLTCKNLYAKNLIAKSIKSEQTQGNNVWVKNIFPLDESKPIKFRGKVIVKGEIKFEEENKNNTIKPNEKKTSFLQTNGFFINGIKQWILVYTSQYIDFHDFKKLKSYGWQLSYFFKNNSNETMSNEGNDFIFYKTIENLPSHEYIQIEANFHFTSPFWDGNAAYLKLNKKLVWLEHHDWSSIKIKFKNNLNNIDFNHEIKCEEISLENFKWTTPISVVLKDNKTDLNLLFGFTINELTNSYSKCFSPIQLKEIQDNPLEMIWIDNLNIYIK